jgi:hypothetical protein
MTVSHAKTSVLVGLFAVLANPVFAQTSAPATAAPIDTSRDASFLPPATGLQSEPASPPPVQLPTIQPATLSPSSIQAVPVTPAPLTPAPVIITAPTPAATPVAPAPTVITPAPTVAATPVAPAPSQIPSQAPAIVAPPTAAAPTASGIPLPAAAPAVQPLPSAIAKPVEAAPIGNIDPESIGLMSKAEGDLGADIWKSTPRVLVVKLFQSLNLPTLSKTLNNLAKRLLLTTASVPEGAADTGQSLTSMRVEKLLMVGDAADAWKLAMMAKSEQIDEITLRMVAEAALISPQRDDVCAKLPEIVTNHNGVEWQKLMLVCQLRANDTKAAQLTLDLLHAQNVKDEIFFFVAEKNILGGNKQLPRQLTPLKPLTLALLRQTDLPLPGEVYVHPDAALIVELLSARAREDVARIGLAERAAERGLISASDLAAVYRGTTFTPESIANAMNSPESGPRLHALLYQAALLEKTTPPRINAAIKYMQVVTPGLLNTAGAQILDEMIGNLTPGNEFNASSGTIAHIYVLAGKNEAALEWIKHAKHAAIGMPSVAAELNSFWPLAVLSGLESDGDYATDLGKWLDAYLKDTDGKNDAHARRDQASSILLLLDADGFAVSSETWAKVMDVPANDRRAMPPALFFERLKSASTSPRKGETIMLALDLAGNGNDVPVLSAVEIVRALRLSGLTADAAILARETANIILTPSKP